ncbi:MAG: ABC transporter permease subunit [Bryobacteraceae bacterium]
MTGETTPTKRGFALRLVHNLTRLAGTLLLAGFLGACLICLAPGLTSDESDLDSRLSNATIQTLAARRAEQSNVVVFYAHYLQGAVRGDFGTSRLFDTSIGQLLEERVPVTASSVVAGLMAAWTLALVLAAIGVMSRHRVWEAVFAASAGQLLCIPAALLGVLLFLAGAPPAAGVGAVIFPRLYRYSAGLLHAGIGMPHVLAARARGLGSSRILLWHVLPPQLPQLIALAGVSGAAALGAAVPIEVICDSPGIGQLAWRAALGRDLPLLVTLTLINTAIVLAANACADLCLHSLDRNPA